MDIQQEIMSALEDYSEEVEENLDKAIQKVAKDTANKLKVISPKRTGSYAKGWRVVKQGNKFIVCNKKYQLTHLLEKGHAKRNGGRVAGIPHISIAEREASNEIVKVVEEMLND